MLTFYEEQNIPAQTYVSKQGDNIRSVSKDLLGFDGAWKEVWATNASVESKGDISEGIELKYWPEGSAPVPVTTAATETAPPPEMPSELPPPTQAQAPMPDPGADPFAQQPGSELPPDVAANDPLAPPPLPDSAAVGSVGGVPSDTMEPPPPPPMPAEPKPVVKRAAPDAMEGTDEEAMDADTTMALGVAGLLILAAAALVIFIRKNRTKKLDMTQTTQI